jgi:tRNA A-37 threonylcarbamoyl transferase component Bud32
VTESSEQNVKIQRLGERTILYDATLLENPNATLFAPVNTTATAPGRGAAIFYQHAGLDLVLKHYHRGGMVAALMGDHYLGYAAENTRSFREWCLLKTLQRFDLPAPVPVLASFNKTSLFSYRADLITRAIPNSLPLADYLFTRPLSAERWQQLGQVLARFHEKNVYHADLNARNILLDEKQFYLIDFDKGRVRVMSEGWKSLNLVRLQRSLNKFRAAYPEMNYSAENWQQLLAGYKNLKN